ncbi:toxin-antitoxin system HicB family antitoxin [Corynebacterium sp. zg-331]|uniref:type II toxin-antitoxin system HicB family antitoxin n=1 Tax=unclassified Corynebacterium TaxID=2624378 RepID=UPI001400596B|nr:toxin-antitoxin system HicB family antitoxin [Corynebacterium sp. zg-331]MPV53422.1 toxin-antitoxin system HicB family antitoxin [Corynebacterium sp. zg331]
MNSEQYTYQVCWSEDDKEYVATVLEFPSLSWLAPHRREAEDGLVTLVSEVIDDMEAAGEAIPTPLGAQTYSGKFQVRTSHSLHRQLVMEAARDGVSLNALVNRKLSAV